MEKLKKIAKKLQVTKMVRKIKLFCIKLPQIDGYVKYNRIWGKIKNDIKLESDSQLVCDKNSLKTRIKSYDDKINTDLGDKKYPKKVLVACVYQ